MYKKIIFEKIKYLNNKFTEKEFNIITRLLFKGGAIKFYECNALNNMFLIDTIEDLNKYLYSKIIEENDEENDLASLELEEEIIELKKDIEKIIQVSSNSIDDKHNDINELMNIDNIDDLLEYKLLKEIESYIIMIEDPFSYIENYNDGLGDLREIDLDELTSFSYAFLEGHKYLSIKDNPYCVLVKCDNRSIIKLHEDTISISSKAFENIECMEELILEHKLYCYIDSLRYKKIDTLIIKGRTPYYLYNSLCYIKTKCICAPLYMLSEFKYKELYPALICGYFKMIEENENISQEVKQSYENYITKNYKKMYDWLSYEPILDYLLENKLVDKDSLYDLLKKYSDTLILEKLNKYKNNNSYDFANLSNEVEQIYNRTQELEEDKINNHLAEPIEFREISPKTVDSIRDDSGEVDLPKNLKLKYETYIRTKYKIDDEFVAKIEDETMIIKAIKYGDVYNPKGIFQIVYFNIGNTRENMVDRLHLINNSIILSSISSRNIWIEYDKIYLYPEYGIFKKVYLDGKMIDIKYFNNSPDTILDKQFERLFEIYFYLEVISNLNTEEEYLVFRKVRPNENPQSLDYLIDNDLLSDVLYLQCAYLKPFKIIESVNYKYVNSKGNECIWRDVLKFISRRLSVTDRTTNLRILQGDFSSSFQTYLKLNFSGFSKDELLVILNSYFAYDFVYGYYYGWDTQEEINDDLLMYDKNWFEILYNYVNKNKRKIQRLTDIYLTGRKKQLFSLYSVNYKELQFFVETARRISSFEEYLYYIKPFFKKFEN